MLPSSEHHERVGCRKFEDLYVVTELFSFQYKYIYILHNILQSVLSEHRGSGSGHTYTFCRRCRVVILQWSDLLILRRSCVYSRWQ